ncbi:hypothetical protein [Aequorivita viscosa]|uniref:Restriction endonuclease n=1 Tax=Aequorivita viscosa TaxID=797419 RepID=A0A1M6MN49_9FLAO|nr:hypothetical protein [Aequorivita viscosa]SDX42851.1 hypothetical protein SAMN05216556_1306 [Aequorivita viscosa]SHJ84806.1 hypothetical protein SAMN04487908_12826 [Aequorivita viscosa]
MLTNQAQIDYLSEKIYQMDVICREDFKKDHIVSERDYVTSFLNFIRYPFGPFSTYKFAHSQTLNGSLERLYGADGIVIFKKSEKYKIGVFEAKIIKKRWDSTINKTAGTSRFDRQLLHQGRLNTGIAIWEMFFNRNTIGVQFDPLGSTCIKRDIALAYTRTTPLWSYSDLENLAMDSYSSNSNTPINVEQIIKEILSCSFGEAFEYRSEGIKLYREGEDIKIPLLKNIESDDKINRKQYSLIQNFLKESNFRSYTHIDLDQLTRIDRDKIIFDLLGED